MQKKSVNELLQSATTLSSICLSAWVKNRRDSKTFSFLELNDGSCLENVQCVIDESTEAYPKLEGVNVGAAVQIYGDLIESLGQGQKYEIKVQSMQVYGLADPETYPLQKKRHSDEFLRTIAHLRSRTNKYGACFRVRAKAAYAVHEFFNKNNFFNVHTPILTGSDCEGAGEMFRVTTLPINYDYSKQKENPFAEDFFAKSTNLTVSGQLEAECLALGLGKVYTFGPTFRAENSNTPRHAAEFWMIEPEAAFFDLADDIKLGEDLTRYVADYVLTNCSSDINLFQKFVDDTLITRLKNIIENDFGRVEYAEAVEILKKSKKDFEYKVDFGTDLQTEHERYLSEEHFKKPVAVYNYPKDIKAFYMRLNDDNRTVAAFDLLVPKIGELIGGSQREERLDYLEKRIVEMGHKLEDYWWYLDLRRFGTVPHSGFGLGFERLLMLITGISNIRDVLAFPRTPGNIEF